MIEPLTLNQRLQVCAFSGDLFLRILKRTLIDTNIDLESLDKKLQVSYLISYLEKESAKTVVIESQYIDRHFLEDYASYHVRSFSDFGKLCTRLHFFDSSVLEEDRCFYRGEFLGFLKGEADSSISLEALQNGYLGFVVIRPLKGAFIGRTCLRTYKESARLDVKDGADKVSRLYNTVKPTNVNLFGVQLKIETTLPFQEQDSAVAACATSALWTFFYGSTSANRNQTPSPSYITKLAEAKGNIGEQSLNGPHGLKPDLVRNAITAFELEYSEYKVTGNADFLKELVFGYQASRKEPLLLGVDVFEKHDDGVEYKGGHLVVVNGFEYEKEKFDLPEQRPIEEGIQPYRNAAHSIRKIYCHDDQLGPFARFKFETVCLDEGFTDQELHALRGSKSTEPLSILKPFVSKKIENDSFSSERADANQVENLIYVPHSVHLGLYRKIRRNYPNVSFAVEYLNYLLSSAENFYSDMAWSITLQDQNTFKTNILDVVQGAIGSTELCNQMYNLLVARLPRFIWCISCNHRGSKQFEILVDATEDYSISGGDADISNGILEVVYHQIEWKEIFEQLANDDANLGLPFDSAGHGLDRLWRQVIRRKDHKNLLDRLYGDLAFPTEIYPHELGKDKKMIKPDFVIEIPALGGEKVSFTLDQLSKTETYNWIIDESGSLHIGLLQLIEEGKELGHPTLIGGEQGRVGGELNYSDLNENWVISNNSGRYSIDKDNRTSEYLKNVVELMVNKGIAKTHELTIKE